MIELRRARARDYSRVFLTKNPFPATPIPEDFPSITVDRERMITHFQDIIANAYEDSRITVTVIVGDYGSGKSHLLKLFKRSVNGKLMVSDQSCLAVYVRTPGRAFSDFLFNFLDDLRVTTTTSLSKRIVREFLERNRSDLAQFIADRRLEKKIDEWIEDPSLFVINSTYLSLFKSIRDRHMAHVGNSDALLAFVSLTHPDLAPTAWRWFLGGNLSKDERDLLQVDTNIKDPKTAYSVFQALLRLFKLCGITSTVVLVDELEKIVTLGSTARTQYQDDLRRIIDDNPTGINMFFSIAPRQHEELSSEPTAFARRLAGDVHELRAFSTDQSASLIQEYLAWARVAGFKEADITGKYPKSDAKIFPFTRTAIRAITEATDGNTAYILLASRKCIEYLMEYQLDVIDEKSVEAVSKRHGGLK